MSVCVYVHEYGCQKRVSDSFEVELQAVVRIKLRSSGNGKCPPLLFHTLVLFASFSTRQIPCSPRAPLTPQGEDLVGIVWPSFFFQICPPFPCSGALAGTTAIYKGQEYFLDDRQQLEGVGNSFQVPIQ